jgi:heterodisulfide reductase subunit A2
MEKGRRIGVYVCHCGTNIAATVNVGEVVESAKSLRGVVVARDYMFMCSNPGQDLIKKDIREQKLNRVVVASCSPLLHERTFRRVLREAGLNPYLFEMANIREQCSWTHHQGATEKAQAIVRAAVMKVYHHEPLQMMEAPVHPATLVVGAGIAGIQASLDIANAGYKVYLVEREPSIGGHMSQLDKTFPTLDCSSCILTPKMSDAGSHPNIELLTYSEVEEVKGFVGNFSVKIRRKAASVDHAKCTGCGVCQEKCPSKIESEFNFSLSKRKAIYTPFLQAVPNKPIIDRDHCIYFEKGKCRVCEKFCEAKAIDFEQTDRLLDVEVGSIIVATGYDPFDPRRKPELGYGRYRNVITGFELERLLSAAGPTHGVIEVEGKVPRSVVFVQCVGSRDKTVNHEYCSRVCCMYTAKHAHLVKDRIPGAKVTVFYIDVRAFGKGYEQFYERVQREGIFYRKGGVSEIYRRGDQLVVRAEDILLGEAVEEVADLVVLAVGMEPRKSATEVMRTFTIQPDQDGFFLERHLKLDPIATSTEGVYIVGCCQGPKDIPDTVAQAKAGAAEALGLLARGKVLIEPIVSHVEQEMCAGCGLCEKICAYGAPALDPLGGFMTVNEVLCKGCGACASICPSGAMSLRHFTYRQILDQVEAFAG